MKNLEGSVVKETMGWRYLFPGLMLIMITWVDLNVSQIILAPLLSLICLVILALRINHRTLTAWLLLYASFVFYMLQRGVYGAEPEITEPVALVRGATFMISSLVVYWVCRQREALSESFQNMLNIVTCLPAPLLISDESGLIVFINNRAREILKIEEGDLADKTYFQVFAMPTNQGQFIANYLAHFEQGGQLAKEVILANRGNIDQPISANWQVIYLGRQRKMITMFL